MKRLVLMLSFMMAFFSVKAADKIITVQQLPAQAQTFIQKNFARAEISYVKMEKEGMSSEYEVLFENGTKVCFGKKGFWKEIECKQGAAPVRVLPKEIRQYLRQKHAKQQVVEIERDKKGYEVKLSNDLSLEFNKAGKLVNVDD